MVTRSFRQWDPCSYQETVSAPWTVAAYWSPLARSRLLLSSFGLTCIIIPSWWLKLFPDICEGPPSLWLQYLHILCLKPDFLLQTPHGSRAGLFWAELQVHISMQPWGWPPNAPKGCTLLRGESILLNLEESGRYLWSKARKGFPHPPPHARPSHKLSSTWKFRPCPGGASSCSHAVL